MSPWLELCRAAVVDVKAVLAQMQAADLRVTLDTHSDKLGAKIRRAEIDKVPYVLVLGQKEAEAQSVSVRSRAKGDEGVLKVDDVIARFKSEVATKALPEKKIPQPNPLPNHPGHRQRRRTRSGLGRGTQLRPHAGIQQRRRYQRLRRQI